MQRWLLLAALAVACKPAVPTVRDASQSSTAASAPAPSADEPTVSDETFAGLHAVVYRPQGARAGETLPMVVAMHGLGDNARAFLALFQGLNLRARVVSLDGVDAFGADGRSWFPPGSADAHPEAFRASVERVVTAMREARARFPTCGAPVVTGFSQGAMMSFALATRGPTVVRAAAPFAGRLIDGWPVPEGLGAVRVVAFHGDADARIPYAAGQQAVERLRAAGARAEMKTYPGMGHTLSPASRTALMETLESLGRCP